MTKPDFTKTSSQLEREVFNLIEAVDRSLDNTHGDNERKGHYVLTALGSVIVVFASIFGIDHLVGKKTADAAPVASATVAPLDARDRALTEEYLSRIETQAAAIRDIRARVAPSMPIDGPLSVIDNALNDLRRVQNLGAARAVASSPAPAAATP